MPFVFLRYLAEGFHLHVRTATLHTILQDLSKKYEPPLVKTPEVPFDDCVPAMVGIIEQDLIGICTRTKGRRWSNDATSEASFRAERYNGRD